MTLSVRLAHALPGLALDIAFEAPGGVTALFGRSGAGKTTVVNAIAGLLRPDAGRIALGGRVLSDSAARIWTPPHRRRIGYVFQDGRLFPHMTVAGNLAYARRFARRHGPSRAHRRSTRQAVCRFRRNHRRRRRGGGQPNLRSLCNDRGHR